MASVRSRPLRESTKLARKGEFAFLSWLTIASSAHEWDIDDEDVNYHIALAASLEEVAPTAPLRPVAPPSPAPSILSGRKAWKRDFDLCKRMYGVSGEVEGYAGMVATVKCESVWDFVADVSIQVG